MWSFPFQTRVPAKWVLAGEHSVLRGATAVALPHPELSLRLSFEPGARGGGLAIEPGQVEPVIRDLLQALQEQREQEGEHFPMPSGILRVESDIPSGAGLGSSAALCVAITRWMAEPLRVREAERLEFARTLEHRFHGKSSGMDVAVVSAEEPISFSLEKGPRALGVRRLPRFTFHDTGRRARTSECVYLVDKFREENPLVGMKTDEAMSAAARQVMDGLFSYSQSANASEALRKIAGGMRQAQACFYTWALLPGDAKRLEDQLLREGALAVKLTGAGGGGFLVALWGDH